MKNIQKGTKYTIDPFNTMKQVVGVNNYFEYNGDDVDSDVSTLIDYWTCTALSKCNL